MKKIHTYLVLSITALFITTSAFAIHKKREYYVKNVKYDVIKDSGKKIPNNDARVDSLETNEVVDLGLPSGTLWATYNVGATKPEEYGYYFAWGETREKDAYDVSTYKWYDIKTEACVKYTPNNDFRVLETGDDAASVNWGKEWRIPTVEEIRELIENCQYKWSEVNGVKGAKFIGTNGNSVFFPAAGYSIGSGVSGEESFSFYWSSSIRVGREYYAHYLNFDSDNANCDNVDRFLGFPVRPVRAIR